MLLLLPREWNKWSNVQHVCVVIRTATAATSVSALGGPVFLMVIGSYSLENVMTDERTHAHFAV